MELTFPIRGEGDSWLILIITHQKLLEPMMIVATEREKNMEKSKGWEGGRQKVQF